MSDIIIATISKEEIKQLIEQTISRAMQNQLQQKPEPSVAFLNVEQAAEFIGITKATLYRKCSGKLIPYNKKGKRLYFDQKELIKWLKSGKRKTMEDIENEANSYLRNRKIQ